MVKYKFELFGFKSSKDLDKLEAAVARIVREYSGTRFNRKNEHTMLTRVAQAFHTYPNLGTFHSVDICCEYFRSGMLVDTNCYRINSSNEVLFYVEPIACVDEVVYKNGKLLLRHTDKERSKP